MMHKKSLSKGKYSPISLFPVVAALFFVCALPAQAASFASQDLVQIFENASTSVMGPFLSADAEGAPSSTQQVAILKTYQVTVTAYGSNQAECKPTHYFTTADGSDTRHGIPATRHNSADSYLDLDRNVLEDHYPAQINRSNVELPIDGIVSAHHLPTEKDIRIDGIVAANFLPFGTQIRMPNYFGDQIFEVHDRLNSRYPFRVDVWVANVKDETTIGNSTTEIQVVKWGDGKLSGQPLALD